VVELYEDRQEYNDGRVRRRGDFIGSCGEKCKPGESTLSAAQRAISEELGLDPLPLRFVFLRTATKDADSVSYPGLLTHYETDLYRVNLPLDLYCADGYVEVQPDKRSIFLWRPAQSDLSGTGAIITSPTQS
jgi:8-oxo-dGTP pyrophosphatase MutT (NUDIX family)